MPCANSVLRCTSHAAHCAFTSLLLEWLGGSPQQVLHIPLRLLQASARLVQENPEIFAKECAISKGWSLDVWGPAQEYIAYSKFVLLYAKWLKLTAQMMVHCLRSGVYSQMRNAIIVLTAIQPVRDWHTTLLPIPVCDLSAPLSDASPFYARVCDSCCQVYLSCTHQPL